MLLLPFFFLPSLLLLFYTDYKSGSSPLWAASHYRLRVKLRSPMTRCSRCSRSGVSVHIHRKMLNHRRSSSLRGVDSPRIYPDFSRVWRNPLWNDEKGRKSLLVWFSALPAIGRTCKAAKRKGEMFAYSLKITIIKYLHPDQTNLAPKYIISSGWPNVMKTAWMSVFWKGLTEMCNSS